MPTPTEILAGLSMLATDAVDAAIAWHVLLAIAIIALVRGWRPSERTAGVLLAALLASVAGFAFGYGNPFNGVMFAGGAIAVTVLAVTGERVQVTRGHPWAWSTGVAMIAFGWVYPHFLGGDAVSYFYAAPVGLVPCPTLSVAVGFSLLVGGANVRAWRLVLASLGLFYGLFGVVRLGVSLDAVLVVGAGALVAATIEDWSHRGVSRPPRAHAAG